MTKNRLLQAVLSAPRERTFRCPRTDVELVARLPSRAEKRVAAAAAKEAWGDRPLSVVLDLDEYRSLVREQLIARCMYVNGDAAAIGIETVDALDEGTLRTYDERLEQLERDADPPIEEWTEEQVAELIDGVKKKAPQTEEFLKRCGSDTLIACIRTLVAQLPS